MVKLYFKSPVPHSQRDVLIRSFKNLDFKYERVIQDSDFSILKFSGRLPLARSPSLVVIFVERSLLPDLITCLSVDILEITFLIERK